jgi:Na+/H+ antiporter NhaD/arsenite permease-like protein
MILAIIIIFITGYATIVFEHNLKINKTASALVTGVLCWTCFILTQNTLNTEGVLHELSEVLSESSEIVFFLLGAMTIVELMDAHNGFALITNEIKTSSPRRLLWLVSLITFFLASVLDTLATTIVMIKLLDKLVKNDKQKLLMAGFVVVAANAGGSWSIIGAPTTTMLWIGGQISVVPTALKLFMPCLLSIVITLLIFQFKFKKTGDKESAIDTSPVNKSEKLMFYIGVLSLLFVPVFKTITHLPPYMGMLLSLGFVWISSEMIHSNKDEEDKKPYSVGYALSKIDIPSTLFFLGILLAIGCLDKAHILKSLADNLDSVIPYKIITATIIGLSSAIVDNIPLLAATMGMYDLATYKPDSNLWQFLAYCVGTGGSILVIGSAAGVAAMSLQKQMTFFWYVKNISLWALIAYVIGICIFVLMSGWI